jgi:hypothetical protein
MGAAPAGVAWHADANTRPLRARGLPVRVRAAIVIGVSLIVGWLGTPVAAVAVFAALAGAALVAYLRAQNPDRRAPLRDAARAPHPHGARTGRRHVLVVANEVLAGYELRKRLAVADRGDVDVDVLAPVLSSRAHYAASDIDHELQQAFLSGEEGFDSTGKPAAEPDPSSRSPEIPPNDGSPRGPRPPKRRDGGHGRAAHPG